MAWRKIILREDQLLGFSFQLPKSPENWRFRLGFDVQNLLNHQQNPRFWWKICEQRYHVSLAWESRLLPRENFGQSVSKMKFQRIIESLLGRHICTRRAFSVQTLWFLFMENSPSFDLWRSSFFVHVCFERSTSRVTECRFLLDKASQFWSVFHHRLAHRGRDRASCRVPIADERFRHFSSHIGAFLVVIWEFSVASSRHEITHS